MTRHQVNGPCHQNLGLRTGNQYFGRHAKWATIKFLFSRQILKGLSQRKAEDEVLKADPGFLLHKLFGVAQHTNSVPSKHESK